MHLLDPARRRAALTALAAATALTFAHAAPSHASGQYVHHSCSPGVSGTAVSDSYGGWQPVNTYPINGTDVLNQCPSGGLHVGMSTTGTVPLGSWVGWVYSAPADTSIVRFRFDWSGIGKSYDGVNQSVIQVWTSPGFVDI